MKNLNSSKIISNLVRISIIIIAIFQIINKQYENLGILAITMLLTFYDVLVEKLLKIKLDNKLKNSITLFIFGAQCLGSVLDFYGKFLWWDTMLHTISGVIFYFVGTTIIEQMSKKYGNQNINKIIVISFGICFALASGVVWEVFEYGVDTFLGQNMQITEGLIGREAIKDTMIDLISVTGGTIAITILDSFLRKRKEEKE